MLDAIRRAVAALLATLALPALPSAADSQLVRDFVEFAVDPSSTTAAEVPFSPDGVSLGLGPQLMTHVPRERIADPDSWVLEPKVLRAYVPPFSALVTVERHPEVRDDVEVSVGPHPHCAASPQPAPELVAGLRRVSFQPAEASIDSCLMWFTVDLFVNEDGEVVAVTLDIWEP